MFSFFCHVAQYCTVACCTVLKWEVLCFKVNVPLTSPHYFQQQDLLMSLYPDTFLALFVRRRCRALRGTMYFWLAESNISSLFLAKKTPEIYLEHSDIQEGTAALLLLRQHVLSDDFDFSVKAIFSSNFPFQSFFIIIFFSQQCVVLEWKLPGHPGLCHYHSAPGLNETAGWVGPRWLTTVISCSVGTCFCLVWL